MEGREEEREKGNAWFKGVCMTRWLVGWSHGILGMFHDCHTHWSEPSLRKTANATGTSKSSLTQWRRKHIMILVRRGRGRATTRELYAKIIAESELLQPALNEIHKFCFQHWSRGRGTCGTGSVAPVTLLASTKHILPPTPPSPHTPLPPHPPPPTPSKPHTTKQGLLPNMG